MRHISMKTLAAAAALAALVALPAGGEAQYVKVSPDCTVATFQPGYTACLGSFEWEGTPANPSPQQTLDQINAAADGLKGGFALGWTLENYIAKSELGKKTVGGVEVQEWSYETPFTEITGGTDGYTAGSMKFSPGLTGTFVLILKAATQWSFYRFDNNDAPLSELKYQTSGTIDQNELSNVELWGHSVPEPSSMLLMGAGLLGLGFLGYRRRDEQA